MVKSSIKLDAGDAVPIVGLGRTAARGASWLGLSQLVRLFLTLVATVFIARLLTPTDYGVIAMTGPVFALVGLLQDFGFGAATIQAPKLTGEQSTGLFWANMSVSGALALTVLALSPLVGWFYGDPRAAWITAAGSVNLLVGGSGLQHGALLNRGMRFRASAAIEITGLIMSYGTTLVLAFILRNYWALFLGSLVGTAIQTILTWSVSNFRPGRPHFREIGELTRFGSHVTGFNFLNFLVRNLDTVLVARFSGAAQAGIYDRSYRLLLLPLSTLAGPLSRLLQPILSQVRNDPHRYRQIFNLALRALVLIMIPPMAVTAALAGPFMLLLLGPQWSEAGRVYFWLALVGVMQPVSNPLGLLYLTTGRSAEFMRWGFLSAPVTVCGFLLAAPYGAMTVAASFFASGLLLMPIRFAYAVRGTPVELRDLYSAQLEPVLGAGTVALASHFLIGKLSFLPLFFGAILLAYVAALATTSITIRGRKLNADLFCYFIRHAPVPFKPAAFND